MNEKTLTEAALSTAIAQVLLGPADEPLTAESFKQRLDSVQRTLCAALQVVQPYVDDHNYAVENDLLTHYGEVQEWILVQLPELLAILILEFLANSRRSRIAADHGPKECPCGQSVA